MLGRRGEEVNETRQCVHAMPCLTLPLLGWTGADTADVVGSGDRVSLFQVGQKNGVPALALKRPAALGEG